MTEIDIAVHFGRAAACAEYNDLSPGAVDAAKKSVLDILGVAIAASGMEPAVTGLIDVLRDAGGRAEATILSTPGQYPAGSAALANGAMAHCLDFDDMTPWGHHCSSSIVPAVLAMAERVGGVAGRDVITAVAVGQDLFSRLRRNIDWRREWHLSSVFGVYAATAAAGRVVGLAPATLTHALGIASMRSAGMTEMISGTGSDLHGMYAGFSAQGAVTAVLLAERGITGIPGLFEGRYGVFASYFAGRYDRAGMMQDLGKDFRGADTLYKAWPCVGTAHGHIQATIDLVTQSDLTIEQIKEIRVHVGDYHEMTCQPLQVRRAPATRADAQYSLPFLVAIAAVRRRVTISDFTDAAIHDPQVLQAAAKVVPVPDPELNWRGELPKGRVEILTNDGLTLAAVGDRVPGSADFPLTWEELNDKFADCAAVAATPPGPAGVYHVQAQVRALETTTDVGPMLRALAGRIFPAD